MSAVSTFGCGFKSKTAAMLAGIRSTVFSRTNSMHRIYDKADSAAWVVLIRFGRAGLLIIISCAMPDAGQDA